MLFFWFSCTSLSLSLSLARVACWHYYKMVSTHVSNHICGIGSAGLGWAGLQAQLGLDSV